MTADGRKRRKDRPIARRIQQARFRDPDRTPDAFDLDLNQRMNWALIHDLATARPGLPGEAGLLVRTAALEVAKHDLRRDEACGG